MQSAIDQSLRCLWISTNASIPANWVRDTAYDGYFLHVATGDTAGTTGGAASHTHTAASHTHTFTGGNSGTPGLTHAPRIIIKTGTANTGHGHNSTVSNSATVTLQSTNNNPYYYTVIVIKPNDANRQGIPASGVCLWDNPSSSPANYSLQSGANGRLLKVAATGADGAATGGTDMVHTHIEDAHSHAAKNSAASNNNVNYDPDGTDHASSTHVHSVSLDSATETVQNADGMPAYDTLALIKNDTGAEDIQTGAILLYGGTIANIPANWEQKSITSGYDMIMGTGTLANIGTVGGNRQHTHTANAHNNHTATAGDPTTARGWQDLGLATFAKFDTHTHAWTIGSTASTINNDDVRAHYPSYKEVILLKFIGVSVSVTPQRTLVGVGI